MYSEGGSCSWSIQNGSVQSIKDSRPRRHFTHMTELDIVHDSWYPGHSLALPNAEPQRPPSLRFDVSFHPRRDEHDAHTRCRNRDWWIVVCVSFVVFGTNSSSSCIGGNLRFVLIRPRPSFSWRATDTSDKKCTISFTSDIVGRAFISAIAVAGLSCRHTVSRPALYIHEFAVINIHLSYKDLSACLWSGQTKSNHATVSSSTFWKANESSDTIDACCVQDISVDLNCCVMLYVATHNSHMQNAAHVVCKLWKRIVFESTFPL